jgi:hypothetical protein
MGELGANLQALSARLAVAGSHPRSKTATAGQGDGGPAFVDLLGMPLDRFAREGACIELRVPWLAVTLWFVPEERDAETLERGGVKRGRVWTARELLDVVAVGGRTRGAVRTIALAKLAVNGEVDRVRWHGR